MPAPHTHAADQQRASVAARLTQLPTFYTYKDVLEIVFAGDEDLFTDAWCDGSLPLAVRTCCMETMGERTAEIYLLRRLVRQQTERLTEGRQQADRLAAVLTELLAEVRKEPTRG